MGVDERTEAEALDLTHPALRIPVVLVVARHEKLAVGRDEPRQRRHLVSNRGRKPVRHVARERDQVGLEAVRGGHDALHEIALERGAHVQAGELDDAEPLQIGGEGVWWWLPPPPPPAARAR